MNVATELDRRLEELRPVVDAVWRGLREEVDKLGFTGTAVWITEPESASYRLERDPASGENALVGEWRDGRGARLGSLVFHPDGSFFVEHDVVRPHPRRPGTFVEAVTAWGRGMDIRCEPRLLDGVS